MPGSESEQSPLPFTNVETTTTQPCTSSNSFDLSIKVPQFLKTSQQSLEYFNSRKSYGFCVPQETQNKTHTDNSNKPKITCTSVKKTIATDTKLKETIPLVNLHFNSSLKRKENYISNEEKERIKKLKIQKPLYMLNNRDSFRKLLEFHKKYGNTDFITDEKLSKINYYFNEPHFHACFTITEDTDYEGLKAVLIREISILTNVSNSKEAQTKNIKKVNVKYTLKNLLFDDLIKPHECTYTSVKDKEKFLKVWKYFDENNQSKTLFKKVAKNYLNCYTCTINNFSQNINQILQL